MTEESKSGENQSGEIITSTIYCVNTNIAYVYELLHGEIVGEKKVFVKA